MHLSVLPPSRFALRRGRLGARRSYRPPINSILGAAQCRIYQWSGTTCGPSPIGTGPRPNAASSDIGPTATDRRAPAPRDMPPHCCWSMRAVSVQRFLGTQNARSTWLTTLHFAIAWTAPAVRSALADLLADLGHAFDALGVAWYLFGAQAAIVYGVARPRFLADGLVTRRPRRLLREHRTAAVPLPGALGGGFRGRLQRVFDGDDPSRPTG
jgi:hypothetical protein